MHSPGTLTTVGSRYVAQALERRAARLALALDVGEEADLVDVVAERGLVARGGDLVRVRVRVKG